MAFGAASTLSAGCAGGPDEQAIHQSEAQYDLAAQLMGEHNFAAAFQTAENAIRLDPDNAQAHYLLGLLYIGREDFPHAEEQLNAALSANAHLGSSGTPALVGDINNTLGVVYINSGRLPEAVTTLRTATSDLMYRTPFLAWGNLGWAYYEQHDYPEAMSALQQAVALQPQFCLGWYRMAQVDVALADSGTDTNGLAHADEALTQLLESTAPECQALQDGWQLRGEVRSRLGRHQEASSDLERCVELSQETTTGLHCQSLLADSPKGAGKEVRAS